jgi:hypothetical protein
MRVEVWVDGRVVYLCAAVAYELDIVVCDIYIGGIYKGEQASFCRGA